MGKRSTVAYHERFLISLILIWKIHILENGNIMLRWSRFYLLKETLVILKIFLKPLWYTNCGFRFTQLMPGTFSFPLSPYKNMKYSQRQTEVCGSTAVWKTICHGVKEMENGKCLPFIVFVFLWVTQYSQGWFAVARWFNYPHCIVSALPPQIPSPRARLMVWTHVRRRPDSIHVQSWHRSALHLPWKGKLLWM